MGYLSRKAQALKQGAIRAMFDRAAVLDDVVSMGIGEPDMITPLPIIEYCNKALHDGYTHYTPNAGLLLLREAIAAREAAAYDPAGEIIVTNGGTGALSLLMQVILDPGDEVLIQDPQWLNYVAQVEYCGGKAVRVPAYAEENFILNSTELEKRITPRTKALMINSPNNPTGAVIDIHALQSIAEVALRHNLLIISDEVYDTLVYDGTRAVSIASLPGMRRRTVVINSFSKAFAMTGWRIGYAAGPQTIIDKMTKAQENFNSCANAPGQVAAAYALEHPELAEEIRSVFAARRELVINQMAQIPGITYNIPLGAFYIFADIRAFGLNDMDFCDCLLSKEKLVCIPGSAFGKQGKGHVRIAYTCREELLIEGLHRLGQFCGALTQ